MLDNYSVAGRFATQFELEYQGIVPTIQCPDGLVKYR
jgi:hypothetical protein